MVLPLTGCISEYGGGNQPQNTHLNQLGCKWEHQYRKSDNRFWDDIWCEYDVSELPIPIAGRDVRHGACRIQNVPDQTAEGVDLQNRAEKQYATAQYDDWNTMQNRADEQAHHAQINRPREQSE